MRVSPRVAPSWERWLSAPVGLVAGVVGGVTNVPSLPLILYFYALGMEKDEFVRSIAVTFLAYKLVQLVSLVTVGLLDGRLFGASLALTAVAVGAFALGLRVQDRLDARAFNRALLVFLSALGVWLGGPAPRWPPGRPGALRPRAPYPRAGGGGGNAPGQPLVVL